MYVSAGIKTYGRVKQVGDVAIVTRFAMFQELPTFPLQSFYVIGKEREQTTGVPFVALSTKTEMDGFPLQSLDWLSVGYAYLRAVCLAVFLFGFIGLIIGGILHIQVQLGVIGHGQPIEGGQTFLLIFALFTAIGMLTYIVPPLSARELQIRQCCQEVLGHGIDPARIVPKISAQIEKQVAAWKPTAAKPASEHERETLLRELAIARCQISYSDDLASLECKTDDLLRSLADD